MRRPPRRPLTACVAVVETNIDDLNPQFYETAMERLFAAGALDVFLTPIQMKKNRPGTLLTAICDPARSEAIAAVILAETSTLGVRISRRERICLERRWEEVVTEFGVVRIKIGERAGRVITASPEYEDCKKAATNTACLSAMSTRAPRPVTRPADRSGKALGILPPGYPLPLPVPSTGSILLAFSATLW